jgi:hypothetical protein
MPPQLLLLLPGANSSSSVPVKDTSTASGLPLLLSDDFFLRFLCVSFSRLLDQSAAAAGVALLPAAAGCEFV